MPKDKALLQQKMKEWDDYAPKLNALLHKLNIDIPITYRPDLASLPYAISTDEEELQWAVGKIKKGGIILRDVEFQDDDLYLSYWSVANNNFKTLCIAQVKGWNHKSLAIKIEQEIVHNEKN